MLLKNLREKLFKLLIFFLPTQLAFHFWPQWSLLWGIRIDYFAPAIYFTDLLVFAFILISISSTRKLIKFSTPTIVIGVGLLILSFINMAMADVWQLALIRWLKVYELIILAFCIVQNKLDFNHNFIKPLSLSVIFFSIIAFIQFSLQKNIGGPLYLLGERAFNLGTVGISTVTIFGREFLRAYSSFSHPNSLGGFSLISLSLLLFSEVNQKFINIKKWGVAASIISILLSFSLSSYLGVIILICFYYCFQKENYFIEKSPAVFLFLSLLVSLLLPVVASSFRPSYPNEQSVQQRLYLAESSGEIIAKSPVIGVGLNNYIYSLTKLPGNWPMVLQPAHNIFLLVFTEIGIVGLFGFVVLLHISLKRSLRENKIYLVVTIILIVFTGLFDHYWLTLQQNQLLFAVILGFVFQ